MKIIGKAMIFKDEYNGNVYYNTSISNKKEDGTYENCKIQVQFKKGMETTGKIEIKDSFLTFYKTKTGVVKFKLVILDYDKEETVIDEELPF